MTAVPSEATFVRVIGRLVDRNNRDALRRMSEEVKTWLELNGLSKYADAFNENDVDVNDLPLLTDNDLREIGLPVGPRRRFFAAVSEVAPSEKCAASRPEAPRATAEAERRQLTVMFCDLVGSTELSQQLDPEDLREINRAYQDVCKTAIERYEGYIARYMGDGVLCYFGYPQAHEDDAERAIHAGLGVVDSVTSLSIGPEGIELGVRVGIATGPVVVGDLIGEGASQESAVVGETPNLAARLQGLADKNAVVIAPSTHDLVGGRFEYDNLGEHSLQGIAESVTAWRVIAQVAAESRFEATRLAGLTPLVGREHEIGLLLDRWNHAREGDGQIALLSGEAGIGKSRITEILRERTVDDDPVRLRYQCSPFYTNTALHPVVEQLQRAAQLEGDDLDETKLNKLESFLNRGSANSEGVVPLLAPLLSIPTEGRYPPLELTPERQKEQTLEALVAQMEGLSRGQPVLLIFEDIHWADPTSLELLELTIERAQTIPVLVVLTYRPEFSPPWSGYTHITSLALNRFTRNLAAAMVEKVTGGKPLPDEVLEQIIEKTDGVPLFVEELTKTILESEVLTEESNRYVITGSLDDVAIPATLHDSLMARLDRLGAVKEVAQTASVIGREFDYDLLAVVSPLSFEKLRDALSQLVDAGLLFRRGRSEKGGYIFKHALVQNAAYESLLKSSRRDLHRRIATALEKSFVDRVQSQPELLAHHYTEAHELGPAVKCWMEAGDRAVERSASLEAVGHFKKGLATVLKKPPSTERDSLELDFQLALVNSLTTTSGWGSNEVTAASARARELCEQLDEPEKILGVLYAEFVNQMVVGEYRLGKDIGVEVLELGERHNDIFAMMRGHLDQGWGQIGLGEFSSNIESHSTYTLKHYDPVAHHVHRVGYPLDQCVEALGQQTFHLWFRGFADQSIASSQEAISIARQLDHDGTLSWALNFAGAHPASLRQDSLMAERFGKEVVTLFDENRASRVEAAWGQVYSGWGVGKHGELDEGISTLSTGLDYLSNLQMYRTTHLTFLADLCLDNGDVTAAVAALEAANARIALVSEKLWEPEILRLKSEVLLRTDPNHREDVEACLLEAIEIARCQESKSLELRCRVALTKLLMRQDKRKKAHDLVAPIYDWFTEGFDTPDLKEAKALLDQLS